jgi:hypothetical protein
MENPSCIAFGGKSTTKEKIMAHLTQYLREHDSKSEYMCFPLRTIHLVHFAICKYKRRANRCVTLVTILARPTVCSGYRSPCQSPPKAETRLFDRKCCYWQLDSTRILMKGTWHYALQSGCAERN